MRRAPGLDALLRRFAALADEQREYVIGLLGQSERGALHLALAGGDGTALSPGLAALVDRCRAEPPAADITPRAAAALLAAVEDGAGGATAQPLPQPTPARGWRQRMKRIAR